MTASVTVHFHYTGENKVAFFLNGIFYINKIPFDSLSVEESKSYGIGMTKGWVNNDRFAILSELSLETLLKQNTEVLYSISTILFFE